MTQDRVALLIDADNVSIDVIEQAVAWTAKHYGGPHLRRAYCTPEAAVKHQDAFKRLSVRPMVNLAAGKNSTDIALAVDAIEIAIHEQPHVIVIASSDSDFAPVVARLRERGCRVVGLGQHGKVGQETRGIYDDYEVFEHRGNGNDDVPSPARKRGARARATTARSGGAARTASHRAGDDRPAAKAPVAAKKTAARKAPAAKAAKKAAKKRRSAERASVADDRADDRDAAVDVERDDVVHGVEADDGTDAAILPPPAATKRRRAAAKKQAEQAPRPAPAVVDHVAGIDPRSAPTLDAVLRALPELAEGRVLAFNDVGQRLRAAGVLSKSGSSIKLLRQVFGGDVMLEPADKPSRVRLVSPR